MEYALHGVLQAAPVRLYSAQQQRIFSEWTLQGSSACGRRHRCGNSDRQAAYPEQRSSCSTPGSRFRLVGLGRDTARLSVRPTAEQDSLIRYRSLLDSGHAARINFGDDTSRQTALPSRRRSMKRRHDDPFSAKKYSRNDQLQFGTFY